MVSLLASSRSLMGSSISNKSTSFGDWAASAHGVIGAALRSVEAMGRRRIFAESTVWENSLVNLVNNRVADAPSKIVRQLLTIRRENNVMIWMPPEIPRWKQRAGDQTFSVTRRQKDHQPGYIAALIVQPESLQTSAFQASNCVR